MTALETVQAYYDRFNKKDWEGMLGLVHPDILHEVNQGEPRKGKELFRSFLQHMDTCYNETLSSMVFFTEPEGKRVAAEFTVNGIYKQTDGELVPAKGQQYTLLAGSFLEVQEGLITRITTYYNLPLWLKLVGG